MVITYVQGALPKEDETLANSEHEQYGAVHGVACRQALFYITARQHGKLIGLVRGHTAYAEVCIEDMLVLANYRGLDVGTLLLEQLYQQYKNSCFDAISLCTNAFQSSAFYEKCGFQLEFIRKSRTDPKLDKYFYVRYFSE